MIESPASLAPQNSHATQVSGYRQPPYPDHHRPVVDQQARPYYPGFLSQDASFINTVASGPSTITPAPRSGKTLFTLERGETSSADQSRIAPYDYWGANKSGSSTNVLPLPQPSTSSSRTGLFSTGRFHPYEMSHARLNEHSNAEAGPSTLAPSLVPYSGQIIPQPSGGYSETTADAEKNETATEESEVPVSNFYCSRIPHVSELSFGVRRSRSPFVNTACRCRGTQVTCVSGCSRE